MLLSAAMEVQDLQVDASSPSAQARRAIETVWRMESARVIAAVARMVRDLDLAEEFAQDALVSALEQWPASGIPERPGAWLTAVARNRALDHLRRGPMLARTHEALGYEADMRGEEQRAALETAAGAGIDDDLLRLIFVACHPLLSRDARAALTLKLVAGLSSAEIARAFLVPEPTVAQRIVRAKRALSEAGVAFEVPRTQELGSRLASVLEVIYLVFNEGYSATAGDDWMRPALCEEALRLGRVLAELTPREPEVHGLVALMEMQASRTRARTSATGEPVLLTDQDRSRWDRLLIQRGLAALARAEVLTDGRERGPYVLQAAIAACHVRAAKVADTDWIYITALYDQLARITGSPVVELNRAVAVAMAYGPEAGLELADELERGGALHSYHLLPGVRADLLAKLGRYAQAREQFERAAALTQNMRERNLLLERAAACRRSA